MADQKWLAVCIPHKNSSQLNINSKRYLPLYKLRNGGVLLLGSGNLVLLDVVDDGEDIQSSVVVDGTNDLMPLGTAHMHHSLNK